MKNAASTFSYILLIKTPLGEYEAWSDLKKYCTERGLAYYSFAKKKFPAITKDGSTIYRVRI
ncbi:MAG: hypothetical protein M0R39_02860 [Prolixibacteraceae bacterium]|nr:hypothetical protein [Prolixibacteraceae bacterium]